MKGVYCLILRLEKNKDIQVGMKKMFFLKGYYVYVGSALNNLEKRIERHKSKEKKMHWHIDYLLGNAKIVEIVVFETDQRVECHLSRKIGQIADGEIAGFGCSDCRCNSHLYYFKRRPHNILRISSR